MDFLNAMTVKNKDGSTDVVPNFRVVRSTDLMVQGKSFYAVWDESTGLWSQDEYDVQRLVDKVLWAKKEELEAKGVSDVNIKSMLSFGSGSWMTFRRYVSHISDSAKPLDDELTFANTPVKKEDHVSKRLPYPLERGSITAWNELVGTLYEPSERAKLEWAIGAIVSGDAKRIQKFLVLYGSAGTGKSTILDIIQKLFVGYYTTFEAKALTGNNNSFATEVFKGNPLVAIQHDGDLSKIEDNTKLNSIVSHEEMTMNEKFKPSYSARINAFLLMGTNSAVKITDAKSGIIRRLIDVQPTGNKIPPARYQTVLEQIDFELGAIAHHCLDVYRDMGKHYYNGYRPVEMMLQTDVFYNFIEENFGLFKSQNGTTLKQAYDLYKVYCEESHVQYKLAKYRFREELRNYFEEFHTRKKIEGVEVSSWYEGFIIDTFVKDDVKTEDEVPYSLVLDQTTSLLDEVLADCPAQLASAYETPKRPWAAVDTVLSDIDTTQIHYVRPPINHIVIDFDLTDEDGTKSAERNLEAASRWPATYAEYSKSGNGVHLHYEYTGDIDTLSRVYAPGIEIKVWVGNTSLRRRLSHCNDIPVATISSGLPLKEKKVINSDAVKSEVALRHLIDRNLKKEIHPGTKPSMDFIHKILEDAYSSGLKYDVSDMRGKLMVFANSSSNQALYCLKLMNQMKFASEESSDNSPEAPETKAPEEKALVFFDIECYPNLFMISWKVEGNDHVTTMINPTAQEVEEFIKMKLVAFNCRRYDNHMLYAASMGYSLEQLYQLSQKLISGTPGAYFGEAFNLSYVDIYDMASKKQSLKKWQVELGIHHMEMEIPWDKPVPKELWAKVQEYCENDVISEEKVFNHIRQDFVARQILAKISGLPVNATTQNHTVRIVFGKDRDYKKEFVYTDLATGEQTDGYGTKSEHYVKFPGYTFFLGKSEYKGVDPSEGGYVYAEPGIHKNVATLDIASMHPSTIEQLNAFGKYTENFSAIKNARIAIKRGEYDLAKKMFDGALEPFLGDAKDAKALSYALKIAINIVYGLTSAKFDNPFKDVRNKDNIVAKRGALFMIDLVEFVQSKGYKVVHVKTDSIKIADADTFIIEAVMEFGRDYGYDFEHEVTYDSFCLVNKAVYIAHAQQGVEPAHWEATGAEFQHPYIFKTLFTLEEIEKKDYLETKAVKSAMYLDKTDPEADTPMFLEDPNMIFIGKVGNFVPVTEGGGRLLRTQTTDEGEVKFHSVTGTKDYLWLEADMVENLGLWDKIDQSYYDKLVDDAVESINKMGPDETGGFDILMKYAGVTK